MDNTKEKMHIDIGAWRVKATFFLRRCSCLSFCVAVILVFCDGQSGLYGHPVKPLKPRWWQASNFSLQYSYLIKHTGHDNKGNNHQTWTVLMFVPVLPTSTIRNIWGILRRICILILWLKGGMNVDCWPSFVRESHGHAFHTSEWRSKDVFSQPLHFSTVPALLHLHD